MAQSATDSEPGVLPRAGARADIPAELGRFFVLHRLGSGGMGVVYAAYDPELDRKVDVPQCVRRRVGLAIRRTLLDLLGEDVERHHQG